MSEESESKPGPKSLGKSKGGSRVLKYDADQQEGPKLGFLAESTAAYMEERERIYTERFGPSDVVFHEMLPRAPHIDVYRFPPSGEANFYTYVTGGMSDLAMNSPAELGAEFRRAELVFYTEDEREEYAEVLRWLAHFVHDNNTWLHWGHTMPNGQPPEPIFGTEDLDTFLFTPSPDPEVGEELKIESDPVHLVRLMPISTAECQLKLDQGVDALYSLLDANNISLVFSSNRKSVV